jgi:serine/threonine protein kinase
MDLLDGSSPAGSIGLIGPYRLGERIGGGGMGVVFQATDAPLQRVVAIKFLSPRLAVSSLARARFAREAQAAAAINHPNIVTIHATGEHEGLPYLVMEYVAGITLAERLKQEGKLEPQSILRIGLQIARGLAAAHARGVIHRDVKPANILLESGLDRVKITDFGLACVAAAPSRLSSSGVLLGTPPYMSPEQAAGAAVDLRSDLFSLGSVLYHLCTGEPPFCGPTLMALLNDVRVREPRPIRDLNPDIPPALEAQIGRLMAKAPEDRFTSAKDLVRALGDQLAEIQGRGPDASSNDPEHERGAPRRLPTAGRAKGFVIVDSQDGPVPTPQPAPDWAFVDSDPPPWWVHAIPAIVLTAVVLIAAIALFVFMPTWWQSFGEEAPIVLLLAFTGLAVFTWGCAQVLAAMHRRRGPVSRRGRKVRLARNAVAASILVLATWAAYREFSAYAQSRRALNVIEMRRSRKTQDLFPRFDVGPSLTRNELETLIGRTDEAPTVGNAARGTIRAAYRWPGAFRTYVLQVEYVDRHPRSPVPRPTDPEPGSEPLWSINDVVE